MTSTPSRRPAPRRRTAWLAALAGLTPVCALAQPTAQPEAPSAARTMVLAQAETLHSPLHTASAPVVKGAPMCADAVHESVQWLADPSGGAPNRVVSRQTTRLCRDGEGRTRQEVERGGRKLVYLNDPVAKESWVIDPERKTARRTSRISVNVQSSGAPTAPGAMGRIDAEVWREYAERMREWARSMAGRAGSVANPPAAPAVPGAPPMPPMPHLSGAPMVMPPQPVVVAPPAGEPGEIRRELREVRVVRLDGDSLELPPAVGLQMRQFAPRGQGVLTPLPPKEIEGVKVNGERTTWTIEAGKQGNERPIVITREVWTSPELALTVQSRDFDPRSGETSYRLQNLRRGEPDAALMKVPAEFVTPRRNERAPSAPGG